jgi:phage baseplate assembly protein W
MSIDPRVLGRDLQVDLLSGDLVRSPQGGLSAFDGILNLEGALLRRLYTPLGGLPAHPSYGCAVWDLLASPVNSTWFDRFNHAIRSSLDQEPRITVLGLTIRVDAPAGQARATLTYSVVRQPGPRNLIATFNLAGVNASAGVR